MGRPAILATSVCVDQVILPLVHVLMSGLPVLQVDRILLRYPAIRGRLDGQVGAFAATLTWFSLQDAASFCANVAPIGGVDDLLLDMLTVVPPRP